MSGPTPVGTSGEDVCLEMYQDVLGPAVCRRHDDHPSIAQDGVGHTRKSGAHGDVRVQTQVAELLEPLNDEVVRLRSMLSSLGFCPTHGEAMPCLACGAGL